MLKHLFLSLAVVVASVSSAKAVTTYNISGSFSGGQLGLVSFDFDITADFSTGIGDTSDGLVINTLTSTVVAGDPFLTTGSFSGPIQYQYYNTGGFDTLLLGGGDVSAVSGTATDFSILINNLSTAPSIGSIVDSWSGSNDFAFPEQSDLTVTRVEPDVIPLPAGGLLLMTGLLVAAGLGHRKKSAA